MTATEGLSHRLRPYPSYKDSGVEWIGEIPENWEVKRLKQLTYSAGRGEGPQYTETSDVWVINQACVRWDGLDLSRKKFNDPSAKVGKGKLKNNDVLINSTGNVTLGRSTVFQEMPEQICIADNHITIVRTDDSQFLPHYLNYLIATPTFQKLTYATLVVGATAQIELSRSALLNTPFPTPPLDEQQAMVAFLDRETARIDELMREQEALLDDLSDKRQATINAAVTGQEISGPRQKVDSIGSLPAHWEIVKLKKLAEVRSGVTKGRDLHGRQLVDVHYLRVANVQDGYLKLDDVATIPMPVEELERYSLKPGDVLMNEGGDNDKLGRGAVWRGEVTPCVHQNHVFSVRPHEVESDWLALINTSSYAKFFFFINSKQSTNLASISSSTIKELPVVLPPAAERVQLLEHVAQQLAQIDELREEVRANIEDMRIHRSTLITAAVTGKIDVRPETE
ncbi:restriction endonuclease subunit S [Deinococcus sp. 6YEL10]|uniref:restriction endonuclease subunit S n=1 Tax=Deinococcus sp. 6YEL10 TaxID=2745870 RepID=UPI001E355928|nr:restriction endonuclease subunit S [Deinococcus sp. 6YEL10]MCD0160199.1 restriction endonuclease subunit S [Deinococcus sp. 6YEL10]